MAIGDALFLICWYYFIWQGKYGFGTLYSISYPLYQVSQIISKITHPYIFVCYHVWLGVCIQVTPLFHCRWFIFLSYLCTGVLSCPLVFYGCDIQWSLAPHYCTLSLAIFYVLWGIYLPDWERTLLGPFPPSVVNTPFLKMGYGVGVLVLLVYPYVFFGVLGLLVLWMLVDSPSEVAGSYFFLLHYFGVCFIYLKFRF